MNGYIYIIKCSQSNKVYIGQTRRNIEQRFCEHKSRDIYSNTKLGQAFKKYGLENFSCEIIETLFDVSDKILNEREIYWIKYYNSYQYGYNMTPGGFNMENAVNILKKPVEKRHKDTFDLIEIFPSVIEAAKSIDITRCESIRKNICKCCKKEVHEVYGFRWNFVGDNIDTIKRGSMSKKPVLMCDKLNHNLILKEFPSAKDASIYLNKINGSQITACCKKRIKSAYGYFWCYKEKRE